MMYNWGFFHVRMNCGSRNEMLIQTDTLHYFSHNISEIWDEESMPLERLLVLNQPFAVEKKDK